MQYPQLLAKFLCFFVILEGRGGREREREREGGREGGRERDLRQQFKSDNGRSILESRVSIRKVLVM